MKLHTRKQRGFTLMELLIVVAIIGVLAAVGLPMYNGYVADAKVKSSKENHTRVSGAVAAIVTQAGSGVTPAGVTVGTDGYPTAANLVTYFANQNFNNPFGGGAAVEAAATPTADGNTAIALNATTGVYTIITDIGSSNLTSTVTQE